MTKVLLKVTTTAKKKKTISIANRLIWNQTDIRLIPNQSENGKYNLISGWCNKISQCVRTSCVILISPKPQGAEHTDSGTPPSGPLLSWSSEVLKRTLSCVGYGNTYKKYAFIFNRIISGEIFFEVRIKIIYIRTIPLFIVKVYLINYIAKVKDNK